MRTGADDNRTGSRFAGAALLLLLYVLSTGPVVKLIDLGYLPHGTRSVEVFYTPLQWIIEQSELASGLFLAYLSLWGIRIG